MRCVLGGLIALSVVGAAPVLAAEPPRTTPALLSQGRAVFQRECTVCHGGSGDGKGPGAAVLTPKPRDFTNGVFKLRSTPSGEAPTDQDLFQTITVGIPGSAMPGFKELPERERWALVAVVKELAKIRRAPRPVPVPPEPAPSPPLLTRGEEIYGQLQCAKCHGAGGRGDGPSALTLRSEDGVRIWATDLTRGTFKGGGAGRDLYLRIATGVDGTPMPSYITSASPNDIWALVQYIRHRLVADPTAGGAKN
jgi:mono/diheme cytochrome c family protein